MGKNRSGGPSAQQHWLIMGGERKEKRIYGRRKSRPLNKMRQNAFDELYPLLNLPEQDMKEDGSIDPASLFDRPYKSLWMEIGFGNGEHLAALMEKHPGSAFIGRAIPEWYGCFSKAYPWHTAPQCQNFYGRCPDGGSQPEKRHR